MISKVKSHPRFDLKEFQIQVKALRDESLLPMFTGQPGVLLEAFKKLAEKRRGNFTLTGQEIREHLEANRKKLFPHCTQADVLKIFQGYRSWFLKAGMIKQSSRRQTA